ncbi:MAG: competence protein ComEA [Microbacteriaceae bacterium]|jgi:competence protein ComEA|nr:competence protein ComEA [Microbacteriaceae bacterium]HEV7957415.1 ComEA family DNA-binding protein [Marisediminicola sp.]
MTSPERILAPRSARVRVRLGAAVVLVLVGLAVTIIVVTLGARGATTALPPEASRSGAGPTTANDAVGDQPTASIFVHLLGAVTRPGLYELRDGDRAVDAVAAAGGFTATADQAGLNLARQLTDGEQIYVPVIGEVPAGPLPPDGAGAGQGAGKVDLNSADEATLDTLPGVGPATAQRILDWREQNGRFTAIEDLLSVTGIGEKTFAELKNLVTV